MSDGGGGEGGGGGHVDSVWNVAGIDRWPSIPHYYGDAARQLMVGAAALLLIASPIYGNNLRLEFPFEVVGALLLVAFAALTNPRYIWVSIGNGILSGVGVLVYATWGIYEYDLISPIAFMLRLAIAIIFLFAFYYSLKTVRSFMLHEVGRRDSVGDFDRDDERKDMEDIEWVEGGSRSDIKR